MTRKVRLAIVGGGPAALVTAFHLTRDPNNQYDITIYEMSWRLGGKTASGRGEHGRIEEHGLHILFGCYHNVFHTMMRCYDELRTKGLEPERHRFRYFFDAITPHHFGVIGDDRTEPWRPIYIQFPSNRGVPGDPPLPSTWDLGLMAFQIGWLALIGSDSLRLVQMAFPWFFDYRNRWKRRAPHRQRAWESHHELQHSDELGGDPLSRLVLKLSKTILDKTTPAGALNSRLIKKLQAGLRHIQRVTGDRRAWSALDFMLALFLGLLDDDVLRPGGFERIDDQDLRDWLRAHGAAEETLASPWMRVIYDAAFSYVDGQAKESIAAGAALRALLLMIFTYKGCFYNKMEAGMGDVIHTPLYLVLKSRDVKFEFFHRLTDARAGAVDARDPANRRSVDELTFATLPVRKDYDPLVPVKDLLCWPAAPKAELIDPSSIEFARQAESYATTANSVPRVLKRGEDFDEVLLAIPGACLPYACPSLVQTEPKLAKQRNISTVQTIAAQLWLKDPLSDLGWDRDSPLLSLFYDPLNTWCDMSHLLPREDWLEHRAPGSVAYFCGPLPHDHEFPKPDALDHAERIAAAVNAQAERTTRELLDRLPELWPGARAADGFNHNLLIDPRNRKGQGRIGAQFIQANYEPHARCTLALPGEHVHRIRAEDSGFSNLFLSGDWTDNGVYLACVEGAFQAGIRTARAIATAHHEDPAAYKIVAEGLLNLQVSSSRAHPPPHPEAPGSAGRNDQASAPPEPTVVEELGV